MQFSFFNFWHLSRPFSLIHSYLLVTFKAYFFPGCVWPNVFFFSFMDPPCHAWVFILFHVFSDFEIFYLSSLLNPWRTRQNPIMRVFTLKLLKITLIVIKEGNTYFFYFYFNLLNLNENISRWIYFILKSPNF